MHQWSVFSSPEQAAEAAAEFMAQKISTCLDKQGVCHIVLPGGNTPKYCLTVLSTYSLNWKKIHWYPGDERCYEVNHSDRNDVMLEKNFWSKLGETNIHTIKAEQGAELAAEDFRNRIKGVHFDVALLGIGEDGHTASLFPANSALNDSHSVVAIHNAPKLPPERVSLGISSLGKAGCRVVLAYGDGKREIIRQIRQGVPVPVNCIGDIHWFIDKAAWQDGEAS